MNYDVGTYKTLNLSVYDHEEENGYIPPSYSIYSIRAIYYLTYLAYTMHRNNHRKSFPSGVFID